MLQRQAAIPTDQEETV